MPRSVSLDEAEAEYIAAIRARMTAASAGLIVQPVRAQALAASRGSTDFGEYFTYFSFFIVVSGLLLSGLFFKLGLEQRVREVGLLFALGFTPARVRRLLGAEGLVLAAIGAVVGMAGAVLFGAAILYGLRTWWVDAVGTTRLALVVAPAPLVLGALGGLVAAAITLLLTLRRLGTSAPKDLLSGLALMASPAPKTGRRAPVAPLRDWRRSRGVAGCGLSHRRDAADGGVLRCRRRAAGGAAPDSFGLAATRAGRHHRGAWANGSRPTRHPPGDRASGP